MKAAPVAGSVITGLVASLCCGGSLLFMSMGLGALWSASKLSGHIPQVLAIGALTIIAVNYIFYRRAAEQVCDVGGDGLSKLRRGMLLSAFFGLAAMAAGFVLLEWLSHAVI